MSEADRSAGSKTIALGPIEKAVRPETASGKACFVVIKGRSVGLLVALQSSATTIGRAQEAGLCFDDPGVSRRHAEVASCPEGYVVRDLGSTNGLFVNGERVVRHVLRDGDRVQIGTSTILKFCHPDAVEESAQRRLYESATRDALVGIYNRQYLVDSLEAELAYCARHRVPLSVLLLDIDHFKLVNDRFGHLAGDRALTAVAGLMQETLRAEDTLARFGGEEFMALLRHTDTERAEAVAERIRARIAAHVLEWEGQSFSLTVSIGIATFVEGPGDVRALFREADDRLYEAKESGRNRVVSPRTAQGRRAAASSQGDASGETQRVHPEDLPPSALRPEDG